MLLRNLQGSKGVTFVGTGHNVDCG